MLLNRQGACVFFIYILPVATTSSKHLMEGKLSVEIFLYNIQPFSLSRLSLQLL